MFINSFYNVVCQVPSQCVDGQAFSTAQVYSPGKQSTKNKTCTIGSNLSELGEYNKVVIPKRARTAKKTPDGTLYRTEHTEAGSRVGILKLKMFFISRSSQRKSTEAEVHLL